MTATDGKLIRQDDIPVEVGTPGVEETQRWYKQQVPYDNYAGRFPRFDEEVLAFVETIKATFRNRMQVVHQRWAFNWATANGEGQTQEREDDVSMPETQKLLNAKVAHMEQSIFVDPMFEAEGVREDLGQLKAVVVGSYVRRLMELARHRDYFGPAARDAQLCNYSAIKVAWTKRFMDIVSRKTEMRYGKEGQEPYWHSEAWYHRGLAEDNPSLHLVDPFWLILDLDAGHVEDLSYIGDESEPFVHTLEEQAELGLYPKAQVKKVRDNKQSTHENQHATSTGADIVDQFRLARQIAVQAGAVDAKPEESHERGARRCRAIELWAWYHFGDGHEGVLDPTGKKITGTHKVVITVADGVVLQFRLNPFDKKFFPYAVAVMNRNGHEMVAPAPFDQVVVMNSQYDRIMSNVHRSYDLANAPFLVTGPEGDFSEPLTDLVPGTIMQMPGDFKEVNLKDLPQSTQFMISMMRREMEELSGKLRVHETPVGTATEVERKLQEQTMLLDRETRIQSEQWRQVCLIIYKMAGQFATKAAQFAVVGKAQALLGKTWSVPPSWLQEEIDFRFLGVDSMHTLGQRSAGITQWMNEWGPLLPTMPNVNLEGLARMQWELQVGKQNMDLVFPDPEPAHRMWTQKEENALLRQGQRVPIGNHDDHNKHADETMALVRTLQDDPSTPSFVLAQAIEHLQDHLDAAEREAAIEAAKQREAQQNADLMAPGGGQPGVDSAAAPGGLEARTKASGLTPGPQQDRTVARTGREGAGISQTQANDAQ